MDSNDFNQYGEYNNLEPDDKKPKKKSGKAGKIIFIILLVAIIFLMGLGIGSLIHKDGSSGKSSGSKNETGASINVSGSNKYNEKGDGKVLTTVEIAKKVKPSVVGVLTYNNGSLSGEGSAVVMGKDKEGKYTYFVTCAHIVSGAPSDIAVVLEDETTFDADIVGYDVRTDIGVIRVKGGDFTPAEFGDSNVLQVGEPVYAIGNPGGTAFYGSFTSGVVSAIDRPTSTTKSAYSMECIQHDAAINPGNSGGALVNSFGQVVGINSSKIADESFEGMGFAIPVSVAKDVVDDIIAKGYVADRPKLGISYIAANQHSTYSMIAKVNKLPSGSIVIAEIEKDSVFTGKDVSAGDMIIGVNGKELKDANVLLDIIEKSKVGDELTLKIARVNDDYTVKKFDVKINLIEDKGSAVKPEKDNQESFSNPFAD